MDELPIIGWLNNNNDAIQAIREKIGCTNAAAAQLIILFDIASFVAPEECICEECRAERDGKAY